MSFTAYARAVGQGWPGRGEGVILLERPVSTHLLARRIVQEYAAESSWAPTADLLAWHQTGGLGREGRTWSSRPGRGVYVSLIRPLEAKGSSVSPQTLPLLVATALCETLNLYLAGRCRLKWPNDLLVSGRKLAGVLIDTTSRGAEGAMAVISFGVNHGAIDEPGATAVETEAPGVVSMPGLTAELVAAVDVALESKAEKEQVVADYCALSLHRPGDTLRCRIRGEDVEGFFVGFDANGFLRLRVGDDERLVVAGEVRQDG